MKIENVSNDPMGKADSDGSSIKCCHAQTRQGGRCGQVAMANGRCYLHGGKSTGPRTAEGLERMRAAKTKHGWRGEDGRRLRELIRALRAQSKALIELA